MSSRPVLIRFRESHATALYVLALRPIRLREVRATAVMVPGGRGMVPAATAAATSPGSVVVLDMWATGGAVSIC
jgi:hypothetical protein